MYNVVQDSYEIEILKLIKLNFVLIIISGTSKLSNYQKILFHVKNP